MGKGYVSEAWGRSDIDTHRTSIENHLVVDRAQKAKK